MTPKRVMVLGGWAPSLIKFRGPLLAAMVARGHQVFAMAAQADPATFEELRRLGVSFTELPLERTSADPLQDARLFAELVRRFRATRPDTVLAYTVKPVVYGCLAARAAGVPHRAAMLTGLGYAFAEPTSWKHRAVGQMARGLLKASLAGCQTVLLQNPDDRDELLRRGLLARRSQVVVTRGSGVDLTHYARAPLPDGPPRFLFVGRLLAEKGIREYVELARQLRVTHPQARFGVVGWIDENPGSVRASELAQWIEEGVIEYAGALTDVRPALARAHVLVLPSYREGTPRSVLEAMSMGRAVITTDAPGCRETVVHDESGLVVPVRDAAALVAAGRRLLDTPGLLPRLAEAGQERARALYDAAAVAAHVLDSLQL